MRYFLTPLASVIGIVVIGVSVVLGAPVVQPSQLVGSWVRTTPANMDGLEFGKDGKVFVYVGNGNDATAADYSVMDDGRLNISMGGEAAFFAPTMVGDQLQLSDPATGTHSKYRKLNSGETIVQAIAQQQQADQKLVQNRNAAVPNLLAQQNLVLTFTGGEKTPPSCALQLTPNGNGYAGRAVFDGKPLHIEQVSAQLQGSDESPKLLMNFTVNGAPSAGIGQISFHPVGTAPNISLTAEVNFGETLNTDPNATATIRPDADLYKQILDHFKLEIARLDDLKSPVVAMLKDYAIIDGTSRSILPAEKAGFTDKFILSRNPQTNNWMGQGQITSNTTGASDIFPVIAQVGILRDKPVIQIRSTKRLYVLSEIDAAGGKMNGIWQQSNNPNGSPAELVITKAVDAKARDEMFAASKASLNQIDGKTNFHAVISDQGNHESQPPDVVTATIATDAAGNVTGQAVYPLEGFTMTLTGKEVDMPTGPQLVLKYSNGKPNTGALQDAANYINLVKNEVWIVSPSTDSAGHMRLEGYAVVNPSNQGIAPVTLQLLPYTDADQAAITQALTAGMKFKVINPKGPGPDDILEFATDADSGKIKVTVTGGGTHLNCPIGNSGVGEIKDQSGFAEMVAPTKRTVDRKANYAYAMFFTPTDQGLYVNAYVYSTNIGAVRVLGRWDALQVK